MDQSAKLVFGRSPMATDPKIHMQKALVAPRSRIFSALPHPRIESDASDLRRQIKNEWFIATAVARFGGGDSRFRHEFVYNYK